MQTSAPGSKRFRDAASRHREAGFTLIEIMVVVALIAIATGLATFALRDRDADTLQEEATRLAALLDGARARSRVLGVDVLWLPAREQTATGLGEAPPPPGFAFLGLPADEANLPTAWLDERTRGEVMGAPSLRLGPEPIIGAQRVILHLEGQQIAIATDGLGPFEIVREEVPTP